MDSCLLANECIDEMAAVYGKGTEVAEITKKCAAPPFMLFASSLRYMHHYSLLRGIYKADHLQGYA